MSLNHTMPEKSAIDLSKRQRQILYDREVKELNRADIASRYQRVKGDGTLKVRGVESYLREARKKRRLAVNTLVYAEQIGYFDIVDSDILRPSTVEFPDYVELPESVHHNETALFEQQKRILQLIVKHDNDNTRIVKALLDDEAVRNRAEKLKTLWRRSTDTDGTLHDSFADYVGQDGAFTELRQHVEKRLRQDSRETLVREIEERTTAWKPSELSNASLTELFCWKTAADELFDKKYSTLRQYKYYRIPDKLEVCFETAQQPLGD